MTTKPIGLYVHIPFCVRKCNYCDFCSFPVDAIGGGMREKYLHALAEEIRSYKREAVIAVDTVFFGGGTPSLLEPNELALIMNAIRESFSVLPDAEITLEANPGTISADNLRAYRGLGVNRLSIGLQSIHENELKTLGRIHDYPTFLDGYRLAREAGFDNVSVDLMYGIPEQTVETFAETLDAVISLKPEHISAYGLIVEAGTPFYTRRDELDLPSEDTECDMYELACERLCAAGYSHYEISNYARPDRQSRHNLHYWCDEGYVGVGVSAYSYFGGVRYSDPDSLSDYLSTDFTRTIDSSDPEFEYAMLALRLSEGLSLTEYEARFSRSFTDGRAEKLARYVAGGYMHRRGDRIAFTERGFYVSNAILADLL